MEVYLAFKPHPKIRAHDLRAEGADDGEVIWIVVLFRIINGNDTCVPKCDSG